MSTKNTYWFDEKMRPLITQYQLSTKQSDIDRIFSDMYKPFYELANFIHYTNNSRDVSRKEATDSIITHMAQQIDKCDLTKCANTFHYFFRIAQTYQWQRQMKLSRINSKCISADSLDENDRSLLDRVSIPVPEKFKYKFSYKKNVNKASNEKLDLIIKTMHEIGEDFDFSQKLYKHKAMRELENRTKINRAMLRDYLSRLIIEKIIEDI